MRRPLAARVTATALASAAFASPARAGNEAHVPTPVLWPADECAVIVERDVDPIVHFDYAIPAEDTELTADELPDSRTHQFVALCRDRALSDLLPNWITRDDANRSAAIGLIDATPTSAEILDESPAWSGCFVRITADDDRRPITFTQAQIGVDWDTTDADVGVWTIAAQTFEPPFNRWRDRPGFVKVVDDRDDPEQDLPALAILGSEQVVEPGATVELEACVDVLPPATLELEWAEFLPELVWQPLANTSVTSDGPLTLAFAAPIEAAERELLVRGRLTDIEGRERIAFLPVRLTVLPCPEDGCSEPPAGPDPEPDTPEAACSCSAPNDPPTSDGLLVLLALSVLLRRRRDPT